jgi:hypothetical protein
MKYPLIDKKEAFPEQPICPICSKNRVFEPHNFVTLNGGSFLLDKNGDSTSNKRMEGFLDLGWHGHHYEEKEDENKDTMARIEVVKDSLEGQFSLYFCSTECLRIFFNRLVDDLEKEITEAKKRKE